MRSGSASFVLALPPGQLLPRWSAPDQCGRKSGQGVAARGCDWKWRSPGPEFPHKPEVSDRGQSLSAARGCYPMRWRSRWDWQVCRCARGTGRAPPDRHFRSCPRFVATLTPNRGPLRCRRCWIALLGCPRATSPEQVNSTGFVSWRAALTGGSPERRPADIPLGKALAVLFVRN